MARREAPSRQSARAPCRDRSVRDLSMGDGFSVGGEVDRVVISLRIMGDTVVPDRLTRMLGVEPTFSATKGETIDRQGVPVTQPSGMWSYDLPTSSEWELSDAIR